MTYDSDLAAAKAAGHTWSCTCGATWPVWDITVRYDSDGREQTLCTAGDPDRDHVVAEPTAEQT